MNAIEAVEYMKNGGKITHSHRQDHWYEMYRDGSVFSMLRETPITATILYIWKDGDEFVKEWNRTGGTRGPGELEIFNENK